VAAGRDFLAKMKVGDEKGGKKQRKYRYFNSNSRLRLNFVLYQLVCVNSILFATYSSSVSLSDVALKRSSPHSVGC
jgi:hypothetical protein